MNRIENMITSLNMCTLLVYSQTKLMLTHNLCMDPFRRACTCTSIYKKDQSMSPISTNIQQCKQHCLMICSICDFVRQIHHSKRSCRGLEPNIISVYYQEPLKPLSFAVLSQNCILKVIALLIIQHHAKSLIFWFNVKQRHWNVQMPSSAVSD